MRSKEIFLGRMHEFVQNLYLEKCSKWQNEAKRIFFPKCIHENFRDLDQGLEKWPKHIKENFQMASKDNAQNITKEFFHQSCIEKILAKLLHIRDIYQINCLSFE